MGGELFIRGDSVGVLVDASSSFVLLKTEDGRFIKYSVDDPDFRSLDTIPF